MWCKGSSHQASRPWLIQVLFHFILRDFLFLGIPSSAGSVPHGAREGAESICCCWAYGSGTHGVMQPCSLGSLLPTPGETTPGHGAEGHFSRSPDYSLPSISLGCSLAYRSWGQPRSGLWSVPTVKLHNSSLESFAQLRKMLSQVGN